MAAVQSQARLRGFPRAQAMTGNLLPVLLVVAGLAAMITGAAMQPRLDSLLPRAFLESLTPQAASKVATVRVVYVPFMRGPTAAYLRPLNLVLYGPNTPSDAFPHEAMHALDPCSCDTLCERMFVASLPSDLRKWAEVAYGAAWMSDYEYWPMVAEAYRWNAAMMPSALRRIYLVVFGPQQ